MKAILVRSLLKAAVSLKLRITRRKGTEQGFLWVPVMLGGRSKGVTDIEVHRTEPLSKPNRAPLGLRDKHGLNRSFSALVQVT